jgi:uncharacterized protein YdaU (DUF1376 family)
MSTQPFLPLFFGDLLAATPTWEGEERALYVLLLAYQWTAGPLPSDVKKMAKMCAYDARSFAVLWKTVGKKFELKEDGFVNARLEEHREKSKEIAKKRAEAGANGAAKRWQKPSQADSKPIANAIDLSCHPSHPIPSYIEDSRRDEASAGTLKTQIYRLAKQLDIAAGTITTELKAHSETQVWQALGSTLTANPAEKLPYFRGCLKDNAAARFKSA